jgi:hypothetical protein
MKNFITLIALSVIMFSCVHADGEHNTESEHSLDHITKLYVDYYEPNSVQVIKYSEGGMKYKVFFQHDEVINVINITKDSLEVELLKKELE